MHTHELDLNAIKQLLLMLRTDISRIEEHVNQTPETHIGELPSDPNYEFPAASSST